MGGAFTAVVRFATLDRWDPPPTGAPTTYGWPMATLGEIAAVRLGVQVPRRGSRHTGEPRPYLRAANVRRGHVDTGDVKTMWVSASHATSLELQAGDLLFVEGSGSIGEVGRAAIWDGSVGGAIHQNSVIRARLVDSRLDPAYVVTWFNSRAGNRYIRDQATTTSGLFHIGAGKLAAAPIPVPPLDIQSQIVASYDDATRRSQVARSLAQAAAAEAWESFQNELAPAEAFEGKRGLFKVMRFAALERWDTKAEFTDLGSLHPVVRLRDVAEIRLGTQVPARSSRPVGSPTPYLRAANVQRGRLDLRDVKTMIVPPRMVERLRLQAGDVLFVEGNSLEEVGRAAVWTADQGESIIQNSIIRVRLTSDTLLPEYVASWFNSPAGGRYARERATTTSGSLWHLGAGKLAEAPLPVPSLADQARLIEHLTQELAGAQAAALEAEQWAETAETQLEAALTSA